MPGQRKPGIWLMEGNWSGTVTDVRTVKPVLQALEQAGRARTVPLTLNDTDDLRQALKRWGQKQHARFTIGYIALHGTPGTLYVGREAVDLGELGAGLPKDCLKGKVLHVGSCSVLDLKPKERREIRAELGVKVLTGFTEEVEWFDALAFELLLFDVLTYYTRPDFAQAYIDKNFGQFAKRLGFVMVRK
jgi:hypothetical protein